MRPPINVHTNLGMYTKGGEQAVCEALLLTSPYKVSSCRVFHTQFGQTAQWVELALAADLAVQVVNF